MRKGRSQKVEGGWWKVDKKIIENKKPVALISQNNQSLLRRRQTTQFLPSNAGAECHCPLAAAAPPIISNSFSTISVM